MQLHSADIYYSGEGRWAQADTKLAEVTFGESFFVDKTTFSDAKTPCTTTLFCLFFVDGWWKHQQSELEEWVQNNTWSLLKLFRSHNLYLTVSKCIKIEEIFYFLLAKFEYWLQ